MLAGRRGREGSKASGRGDGARETEGCIPEPCPCSEGANRLQAVRLPVGFLFSSPPPGILQRGTGASLFHCPVAPVYHLDLEIDSPWTSHVGRKTRANLMWRRALNNSSSTPPFLLLQPKPDFQDEFSSDPKKPLGVASVEY